MSLLSMIEGAQQSILRPSGGCHSCPRKRVGFVPPTLKQTKVIFVSDVPSQSDVERGSLLSGQGGQLLRRYCLEAGITDYSATAVVKCGHAPLAPKETSACLAQYTMDEIRDYPIVVLLGGAALAAVFPAVNGGKAAKLTRFRGNVAYHPDFPGQRFYTLPHPGQVLRKPQTEGDFARLVMRLGRIVAGEPDPGWRLIDPSSPAFREELDRALAAPLISLDIETNKLESWLPESRIHSLALTADGQTVLFASDKDPAWRSVLEGVKGFLSRPEKHVVGMNTGFDLVWLEDELGFRVACQGKHDVAVIYYEAKQYKMPSLKELVSNELDGYRYLVYRPEMETDLTLLARYNAEDVIYALQLWRTGMGLVPADTRDLVMRVLGPANYVLRRMTRNGIYLRGDYRRQKIDEYHDRRRAAVAAWKAADPDFIPETHESGKGLEEYLFKIKGLDATSTTESGAASTDKAAIKAWIRGGATYLEHLLKLREIDKLLSTYLTAYDKYIDRDGRVRSSYLLTWTDTGRTSSRDPNLQNIPRNPEIRDLFGAAPGGLLIESDLSQIEFRIMVSLAKDETGIQGYLQGLDAHTMTARAIAGPNATKKDRTNAKAVNFALLYGGEEYTVQRYARDTYGIEFNDEDARQFVRTFFGTYKRMRPFHGECHEALTKNRGWFHSATGHNYFYEGWDSKDQKHRDHIYRSALNAQAQGPAAQICFLIMAHADRLLQERGLGHAMMVNTVHDSIMTEVPNPARVMDVIATIEEAKCAAHEWVKPWFPIPLLMDHKVGESWGRMNEVQL